MKLLVLLWITQPLPPCKHVIMNRKETEGPFKKNLNQDTVYLCWRYCAQFVYITKCWNRKNKCYPWHLSRMKNISKLFDPSISVMSDCTTKGDDFVTHPFPNKASVSQLAFQDVKNTSKGDGYTYMLISMRKSLTPGKFLTILVPAMNSATTQNLCACQLRSTRMYEIISTL